MGQYFTLLSVATGKAPTSRGGVFDIVFAFHGLQVAVVKWLHYNNPMSTPNKTKDWAIRVNGDEPHPLPHVHVGFRDGARVSVCIATGRVLVGGVKPPARLTAALDWISNNREALFAEYRRLNP